MPVSIVILSFLSFLRRGARKRSGAATLALLVILGSAVTQLPRYRKVSAFSARSVAATFGKSPPAGRDRGSARLSLLDRDDLAPSYSGPPEIVEALQQNAADPLSLASADFDEDGVPDLICGYSCRRSGIVTLLRGDVSSIYPRENEGSRRGASSPFLSPAAAFALPEPANFIGAGDFDGDGHWDVVAAARGSDHLCLLAGDGRGSFAPPGQIPVRGTVTTMCVGEVNRRDGLEDLVVGISSAIGPEILVFAGPSGAVNATPEVFELSAEATSLALGQFDRGSGLDLAVAAGSELLIVHGRDAIESADEARPHAIISPRLFPFTIESIAAGDFAGDHQTDLALLSDDGAVHVLKQNRGDADDLDRWSVEDLPRQVQPGKGALVSARMSGLRGDDLLLSDGTNGELRVVMNGAASALRYQRRPFPLAVKGEPIAVLPMRLNSDALSDFVVLTSGQSAPIIFATLPGSIITVNSADDTNKRDTELTLREALLLANSVFLKSALTPEEQIQVEGNPAQFGPDEIRFNIPGPGVHTISPVSALPPIVEPLTIDGYSQPGSRRNTLKDSDDAVLRIELSGDLAGDARTGLEINAASMVSGLIINHYGRNGIELNKSGGNIIEGNFIGADAPDSPHPTKRKGNNRGVVIGLDGSSAGNLIGGTTPQARNLISGNRLHGVFLPDSGAPATNNSAMNVVAGNFIGLDSTGLNPLRNGREGVQIQCQRDNTVGGATAGSRNIISGNSTGIEISRKDATGNLVRGNFIGCDAKGAASKPNRAEGILIWQATGSTIKDNVISGNDKNGVVLNDVHGADHTSPNLIEGNLIGVDQSGARPLGNGRVGILVSDAEDTVIIDNVASSNGAAAGGQPCQAGDAHGISIGGFFENPDGQARFGGMGAGSRVELNFIGTDRSGTLRLGNCGNGIFVENNSLVHTIQHNKIVFNKKNGVCVPNEASDEVKGIPPDERPELTPGKGIRIRENSIFGNAMLGIDLGNPGATPNISKPPGEAQANDAQNFPAVANVTIGAEGTALSGSLTNPIGTRFRIEFFYNTAAGQEMIGTLDVETEGGHKAFGVLLPRVAPGGFINATATNLDTGDTSEFSRSPTIQRISVTSEITITGSGFMKPAHVFIIDELGETEFADAPLVKRGTKIIQRGKLKDGRTIEQAIPPRKIVLIRIRNGDAGETEVQFRN